MLPGWVRRALVRLATPSYTVGAVLVLRRPDGSVLLVDQRHTGGWALPGGLLKRGEQPVEGLVREVSEEVRILLTEAGYSVEAGNVPGGPGPLQAVACRPLSPPSEGFPRGLREAPVSRYVARSSARSSALGRTLAAQSPSPPG